MPSNPNSSSATSVGKSATLILVVGMLVSGNLIADIDNKDTDYSAFD